MPEYLATTFTAYNCGSPSVALYPTLYTSLCAVAAGSDCNAAILEATSIPFSPIGCTSYVFSPALATPAVPYSQALTASSEDRVQDYMKASTFACGFRPPSAVVDRYLKLLAIDLTTKH